MIRVSIEKIALAMAEECQRLGGAPADLWAACEHAMHSIMRATVGKMAADKFADGLDEALEAALPDEGAE